VKLLLFIGGNDLRIFLRNRMSWVWLILMPMAFVYFMGFAVRGPRDPSNPRPTVRVENLDRGFLGGAFVDHLGAQGMDVLPPTNRSAAPRGIRVPVDFTERVLRGEQGLVELSSRADANADAGAMVELRLVRALVAINSDLIEHAARAGAATAPTAEALRELRMRTNPPVRLEATFAGRRPMPAGFNLSLPGNLVMYMMMNLLIFGGASLAAERRGGLLRRLSVHPIRPADLVMGKLCGLMLLALVQIVVFLVVGQLALKVPIAPHLGAILLTLVVYAWVVASLGLLIGAVCSSEDKVVGLALLCTLVMAALGGCWWPLELAPPLFKTIAHLIPTGWAMDILHQLISFGSGFAETKGSIGVLALFGLGANIAAARFFRV